MIAREFKNTIRQTKSRAGVIVPFLLAALITLQAHTIALSQTVRFAVIGDYGWSGQAEADVATMVNGWNPEFIITTGDNNYEDGSAATIDQNIGQYYQQFIFPYTGAYGQGDTVNRFFPSLGNHDWNAPGAQPYLDYFTLPGNERYYDFVAGNVQFFFIDSDTHEPDGTSSSSIQGQWLKDRLSTSTARWKVVLFHHPPYTSGTTHGPTTGMRWPFQEWGATAVLSGHEHIYERIEFGSFPYMINGLGGKSLYPLGTPIAGSEVRYNSDYGAQLVTANDDSIEFAFYTRAGTLVDRFVIRASTLTSAFVSVRQNWNMVSVPITVSDPRKTTLFPTAVSPAYAYEGSYLLEDTLVNGGAYWLKFYANQTIPMNGSVLQLDTIDVDEGWNMIGSIDSPLAVASIGSIPSGIVTSKFFSYQGVYVHADSIRPGLGYWVKVNQSGKLILASSSSAVSASNRIRIVPTQEEPPGPPERNQAAATIPVTYSLAQNYPNPFNPSTLISFSIPKQTQVRIEIFDPLGQLITTLLDEDKLPGNYTATWDASTRPSGLYFYRITAGNFRETKEAVLLK